MCNSLVGYTQSHLCQPTEHKGWDSPQLQSPAHSTTSFISFWFTHLSCQLTLQLVHMCLLKPEWTGHLQLIMTLFHMFAFFLLWLISVLDPESVWCGGQWLVLTDQLASFPEEVCVEIGDCCFFFQLQKLHGILHLPHSWVSSFFLSEIQPECSLLGDCSSFFFHMLPHTVMPWAQPRFLLQPQDKYLYFTLSDFSLLVFVTDFILNPGFNMSTF